MRRQMETSVTPDKLIDQLIATGTMNEETLADLERMRGEHAAGTLDPDDESYLRALHARLTGAPMPAAEESQPSAPEPERLDGLSIAEWRDRALKAEAELAEIRNLQPGSPAAS
jgi:hypothetical protein